MQEQKESSLNKLNVTCDNCEGKFVVAQNDIKEEVVAKGVTWRNFQCPNCRMKYTTYIGNQKVINFINKRNALREKARKEAGKGQFMNQKRYNQLLAEDNAIAKKIKNLQSNLKEVHNIAQKESESVHRS